MVAHKTLQAVLLFAIVLFICPIQDTFAANILIPMFFGTRSHRDAFEPYFIELANRGHNVTIISSYKSTKEIKNFRDLSIPAMHSQTQIIPNMFENKLSNNEFDMFAMMPEFIKVCRRFYEMPKMDNLLKEKFELIIVNAFMNECTFGLVHHFNVPFIFFSSTTIPPWIAPSFGSPTLPSCNPHLLTGFSDEMGYWERVQNLYETIRIYYKRNYVYNKVAEEFYREYFPDTPSVNDMEKRASLILSNTHVSINYPRAKFPDVIDVGGLNCPHSPKSLPQDIQEFLDGSGEDGFIYFSMGSFIKASTLPEYLRLHLVNTFAKLKQRVLWKWDKENMADLPPNVKLGKWLPQHDILRHPKIRLFITHGGILSVHEGACYGVPMIGIPVYTDQHGNLEVFRRKRMALIVQLADLTEETMSLAINTILNDSQYTQSAKQLGIDFRDNLEPPLEKAVYWTEYVLKHKGAPHLRSPARDLNFFQYHSLDVFALFLAILLTIMFFIVKLLKSVLNSCISKNSATGKAVKRVKKE